MNILCKTLFDYSFMAPIRKYKMPAKIFIRLHVCLDHNAIYSTCPDHEDTLQNYLLTVF